MGRLSSTKKVKLIVGFIFNNQDYFLKAKEILTRRFGEIDCESQVFTFEITDYYKEEFGPNLKRVFLSFKKPIYPQQLPAIKLFTVRIEKMLSLANKRLVNIDPGYLDLAKLVLASTKDYVHRIYLDKGIYAETTLFYQDKSFQPWKWTYPDFRLPEYIDLFNRIRKIYAQSLN
jgi:hypothetical protein